MKMKLRFTILLVAALLMVPLFQGCWVAAIGAGVGAVKYSSAKQKEAYGKYRTDMEKLNFEREKSGLEPRPIMTYEEWAEGNN